LALRCGYFTLNASFSYSDKNPNQSTNQDTNTNNKTDCHPDKKTNPTVAPAQAVKGVQSIVELQRQGFFVIE
jgi:hypothetical protein